MKMNTLLVAGLMVFMYACQPAAQKTDQAPQPDFSGQLTEAEISGGKLNAGLLWKYGRIAGGQISPDGKQVLYTVTRYDASINKKTSNVYVIPVEGGEPNKLTEDRFMDVSPAWTPDGKQIAWLSDRFGSMQIWLMNADGSARKQLTDVEGGINSFIISPDGNQLLYCADVKLDTSVVERNPDLHLANAIEADDLMYRHWNDWTDYKYSHIFVATINNELIKGGKDIMEGEKFDAPLAPYFEESEITWSPDSKTIAYTCKKLCGRNFAVSTNSDIYLYDVATGKTIDITSDNPGYDRNPVFSPDSKQIAWMSMKTPGYESDKERLMVKNLETGAVSYLNENWDQNANNYIWSADGKIIYFISGINATFQLYSVDVASKAFTQITKGAHDYTQFSVAGNLAVGAKMTQAMATELFTIDLTNGEEKQLTFENKNIYDHIKMGKSEERWVTTTDGKKMLVWVIYPPDFDPAKKYPALLYCQGGPQSAVSQFFSYRWNFQMMAAHGYIVVAPNRRGLPSFGEEWNAQISTNYYGQNMDDYLSAIDDVAKEPYVDKDHLGCVGASYGGYSVYYLASHHQKRFKAFIAHCGMFNLESFYAATEETFFPNHDLGGPYWDSKNKVAQAAYAHSPHKFVQDWDTPIMIVTGGNDFRIPYTESLQAFNAAQLRGIPSRLLFFPEESHFVMKPQNSILWQREFFRWLDQWLKVPENKL